MKKMAFADLSEVIRKVVDEDEFYKKTASALTPVEWKYIRNAVKEACCSNCTNGCCTVPSNEKYGVNENGKPVGHFCLGWQNDIIVGQYKVLGKKAKH